MPPPHASAFDLTCDECAVDVTIDILDEGWHHQLSRFADSHAGHIQTVVPLLGSLHEA